MNNFDTKPRIEDKIKIGERTAKNRVIFQPMEGCDCRTDGTMSELTERKYLRFAKAHAGMVWFEANAVCAEGRTNLHQMQLTYDNLDGFKRFIELFRNVAQKECGFQPLIILQLTHSGRQSIKPIIAYRNDIYEKTKHVGDECIASDEYLDSIPEKFAQSARLAYQAGFDGVDIKSCHGYLLAELTSAYHRKGRYGGSLDNRTRLFFDCITAARSEMSKGQILTSKIGVYDAVPYPFGFGSDKDNNICLTEPKLILKEMAEQGIALSLITLGNPYYNPHINRPYKKGGYTPPEPPENGLARFTVVTAELKKSVPDMLFGLSGLSYYRSDLMNKANVALDSAVCDMVGFGRVTLSYPDFYKDYADGKFDPKKCCFACSKCTQLMRAGQASGCAVFDDYYRGLFKEKVKS